MKNIKKATLTSQGSIDRQFNKGDVVVELGAVVLLVDDFREGHTHPTIGFCFYHVCVAGAEVHFKSITPEEISIDDNANKKFCREPLDGNIFTVYPTTKCLTKFY